MTKPPVIENEFGWHHSFYSREVAKTGRWIAILVKISDLRIISFNKPDTLIPDPSNPLDFNRYGYARYNPLKYTDPSGHGAYCGDDYDPGCLDNSELRDYNKKVGNIPSSPNPDGVELTEKWGEPMNWLFQQFLAAAGWWQGDIAYGADPITLFLAFILSKEWSSAWRSHASYPVGSGWGTGVEGEDPSLYLAQATATWFWNWEPRYDNGDPIYSDYVRSNDLNNVLNWMGSNLGSAQKVFDQAHWDPAGKYVGKSYEQRLLTLMPESMWNDEFYALATDVINPSDSSWKTAEPWTWGNEPPSAHSGKYPIWQWDGAYIYAPNP